MKDINSLKLSCISNIILYMDKKNDKYKIEALSNLKELAKCYHLKLKKVKPIELNKALIQFLENKKGMSVSINLLHSSINQ